MALVRSSLPVVITWYPADPTHGGKNLTACCFRAGSVASKPKCAACTARCYEKPPPPPPPPAPPVPVSQREAMLWVYMHNESNTTVWDEYLSNFSRWMRPNVTSVSLCMYRCLPDGSFGYVGAPHNLADTGLNQECVPPWQIPRRPPRPTPHGTEPRVTPPSLCLSATVSALASYLSVRLHLQALRRTALSELQQLRRPPSVPAD